MRGSRRAALASGVAAAVLTAADAGAHRLDECLQAARIDVQPRRIEVDLALTPGTAVAERILGLMDRNGDRVVSDVERQAHLATVLRSLALEVDGRALDLEGLAARTDDLAAVRRGEGSIHLTIGAALPILADGAHEAVFRNDYAREISVYLANALVPETDRIAITAQRRDVDQRELTIGFVVQPPRPLAPRWAFLSAALAVAIAAWGWRTRIAARPRTR